MHPSVSQVTQYPDTPFSVVCPLGRDLHQPLSIHATVSPYGKLSWELELTQCVRLEFVYLPLAGCCKILMPG